jgi:hypothetical protein
MRTVKPWWMAFSLAALLAACAPQNPPQRPDMGYGVIPAAVNEAAEVSSLKFTEDYEGHVCQVGSSSCLSLDKRPFAPCLVSERCNSDGDVVLAAKP